MLESRQKRLYGIEVKTSSSVSSKNFKGLRYMKEFKPKNFVRSIVLYTGDQAIKLEDKLSTVPISTLWLK